MQITFPYGRGHRDVIVPDQSRIITAPDIPTSSSPIDLIRGSISKPINSPPIDKIIGPGSKVLIIVSDHTRPVPNSTVLTALERAETAGGQILCGGEAVRTNDLLYNQGDYDEN